MKTQAVFFPQPGKTEVRDVEVTEPAANEVQVRCLANGICMYEVSVFRGTEPCGTRPMGHEGVGLVTKVGKDVPNIQEGDYLPCGSWTRIQNVRATTLPRLTARPQDPALYVIEPVDCVVRALRAYDITPGDRALLMGSGFMGLLNVQGLSHCPLTELVVTDVNPDRLRLAREFGATATLQAGTPDGDASLQALKAKPFDLVIDAAGTESVIRMAGDLTRNGGRLAIFAWHHGERTIPMTRWHMGGIKVLNTAPSIAVDHNVNNCERAIRLMERGVFDLTKLVTHRHRMEDVQAAMEVAAARPPDYIKGVLTF